MDEPRILSQPVAVIPTYNERENLERLVLAIRALQVSVDVLIVDDNSPDGTGQLGDELSRRFPGSVHVLHRQKKEGLGRAYLDAFRRCLELGYDYIIQMDCDFSHDPSYLPEFLTAIQNADLVLGSRYCQGINVVGWDFRRLLLSKMATAYVRLITGMKFTDATGGFKCWRRTTLQAIEMSEVFSNGYLFQIEMTHRVWRKKLRIAEIPIIFYERHLGHSKMSFAIIAEALWGVLRLCLWR